MKKYKVYFQIYGKKMRTTVEAISKEQAERIVRYKLDIIKVEEISPNTLHSGGDKDFGDTLKNFLGI